MKGFKRQTAGSDRNTNLPITPQILRAMKQMWQEDKDRDEVSTYVVGSSVHLFFRLP